MTIKFSWGGGCIAVDAELMILDLPMTSYKKWVKLFVQHGEPADHEAFLQLLEDQIQANEQAIKDETDKKELPHLRHLLKRRVSMRDQLKGRLS